jgi:hypothetical protein
VASAHSLFFKPPFSGGHFLSTAIEWMPRIARKSVKTNVEPITELFNVALGDGVALHTQRPQLIAVVRADLGRRDDGAFGAILAERVLAQLPCADFERFRVI